MLYEDSGEQGNGGIKRRDSAVNTEQDIWANLTKASSIVKLWFTRNTKISEINLSAFIYRLFHEDFSSIIGAVFIPMIKHKSS